MCLHLPCHIYPAGEGRRWMSGYRRPQQQASLCWQSYGRSRPSIPPPHRRPTSVWLTRQRLATAAALGMEWVEWAVYTFGFTAVSLVMDSQSILCGFKCVDLVHSTSRPLQRISWHVDWPTRQRLENRNRNLGFSSKTEPKPIENGKSRTVTTLILLSDVRHVKEYRYMTYLYSFKISPLFICNNLQLNWLRGLGTGSALFPVFLLNYNRVLLIIVDYWNK